MARVASAAGFRALHSAMADPARIRIVEALWVRPQSARELAGVARVPADRLYYHLRKLEAGGLIRVVDYRTAPSGNAERIYGPAEEEPPADDASPADRARFLGAVLEATRGDVHGALMAKQAGEDRTVSLFRGMVRLSGRAADELRAHFDELVRDAAARPDPGGVWTRVVYTFVDLQDRRRGRD